MDSGVWWLNLFVFVIWSFDSWVPQGRLKSSKVEIRRIGSEAQVDEMMTRDIRLR